MAVPAHKSKCGSRDDIPSQVLCSQASFLSSRWPSRSLSCPHRSCPICTKPVLPSLCDGTTASLGICVPPTEASSVFLLLLSSCAALRVYSDLLPLESSRFPCLLQSSRPSFVNIVRQCHHVFLESSSATSQAHTDPCFPSYCTQ